MRTNDGITLSNPSARTNPPAIDTQKAVRRRAGVCAGRGKYGDAVLATTGGHGWAGCPRAAKRNTANRPCENLIPFCEPRTPRPSMSECRSEHAFHISPPRTRTCPAPDRFRPSTQKKTGSSLRLPGFCKRKIITPVCGGKCHDITERLVAEVIHPAV